MEFILTGIAQGFGLLWSLDPQVYGIASVSLWVSSSATCLAAILALPLGLAIAMNRFPGRHLVIMLFNTLMALPTVVVGLLIYGFISNQGPLGPIGLLYTPYAMILAQMVLALPLTTALVISAVESLDKRVRPTAQTLGAGRARVAWTVISEARFAVLAALAAGFGRVLTEVGAAIMVGGNIKGYTRTLTTAIALETSKGDFAQGMALGIILLTCALAVNLMVSRLQRSGA